MCLYPILVFRKCTGECTVRSCILGQHPQHWLLHCCASEEEQLWYLVFSSSCLPILCLPSPPSNYPSLHLSTVSVPPPYLPLPLPSACRRSTTVHRLARSGRCHEQLVWEGKVSVRIVDPQCKYALMPKKRLRCSPMALHSMANLLWELVGTGLMFTEN